MVTSARRPIHSLRTHILLVLILAACNVLYAQKDNGYLIVIKLRVGGTPITGFLHSVNDSAVVIIPGMGGKKALAAALEQPRPISIPLSLVKKVSLTRVKTFAHAIFAGLGIFAAYSIAYAAFIPIETPAGAVIYLVTVGTASALTATLIYTRRYKPTDPGFTITMQKYCLVKTGIVADGL